MSDVAPLTITKAEPAAIHMLDPADLAALRLHQKARCQLTGSQLADWQADYLPIIERMLRSAGLTAEDCAPLREIADALRGSGAPGERPSDKTWEKAYAEASAEIAYLVLTGVSESEAAQRVARSLLARGIPLPTRGGDARGWKRLLEFRENIRDGTVQTAVAEVYQQALRQLKSQRPG